MVTVGEHYIVPLKRDSTRSIQIGQFDSGQCQHSQRRRSIVITLNVVSHDFSLHMVDAYHHTKTIYRKMCAQIFSLAHKSK